MTAINFLQPRKKVKVKVGSGEREEYYYFSTYIIIAFGPKLGCRPMTRLEYFFHSFLFAPTQRFVETSFAFMSSIWSLCISSTFIAGKRKGQHKKM